MSKKLFDLIKSLNQSEKRYFKVFASSHVRGEQNNYVKLFDAIDKQEAYNEARLLQKFSKDQIGKQFSVSKNYLYNILLRSLRNYNSGKSIEAKITENLSTLRILYTKGLQQHASNLCKKTKKLARDYEHWPLLLKVISMEEQYLSSFLKLDDLKVALGNLHAEKLQVLEVLQNEFMLYKANMDLADLLQRYELARTSEERELFERVIKQNPLLADRSLAISFDAQSSWLNAWGIYYSAMQDQAKLLECDEQILGLYEANPHFRDEFPSNYAMATLNLLHTYKETQSTDKLFVQKLQYLRELPKKYAKKLEAPVVSLLFIFSYSIELDFHYKAFDFKECLRLWPEVKTCLRKYQNYELIEYINDIYFVLAKVYFFMDDFKQSAEFLDLLQVEERNLADDHTTYQARILNLLLHYEFGNYSLLEYELKSTRRFLKNNKRLYAIESLILKYLLKLIKAGGKEERVTLCKDLRVAFQQLVEDPGHEEMASSYMKFPFWIESQIQNKGMRHLIEERNQHLNAK